MTKISVALSEFKTQLHPGEEIVYWVPATWVASRDAAGSISGVLVLTQIRVVFHGGMLWHRKDHSMPLDTITSIDLERGLVGRVSVLAAAGSTRYTVNRAAAAKWVHAANGQLHTKRSPAQMASGAPALSTADELAKLASLRSAGILTDGEFEAAKVRLLRS